MFLPSFAHNWPKSPGLSATTWILVPNFHQVLPSVAMPKRSSSSWTRGQTSCLSRRGRWWMLWHGLDCVWFCKWRAIYLGLFFWFRELFWDSSFLLPLYCAAFLLLCFFASLLFCFLLFCFSDCLRFCFSAFLLFCFYVSLLFFLLCFSFFLLFCFLFVASPFCFFSLYNSLFFVASLFFCLCFCFSVFVFCFVCFLLCLLPFCSAWLQV